MSKQGFAFLLAAALAIPALAQETTAGARTPGINKRQVNQQRRIRAGVKSGELTRAETRRLEAEQGKIEADKLAAKSDGTVTKEERAKLHHEQNRAGKRIYREKHDPQKRP